MQSVKLRGPESLSSRPQTPRDLKKQSLSPITTKSKFTLSKIPISKDFQINSPQTTRPSSKSSKITFDTGQFEAIKMSKPNSNSNSISLKIPLGEISPIKKVGSFSYRPNTVTVGFENTNGQAFKDLKHLIKPQLVTDHWNIDSPLSNKFMTERQRNKQARAISNYNSKIGEIDNNPSKGLKAKQSSKVTVTKRRTNIGTPKSIDFNNEPGKLRIISDKNFLKPGMMSPFKKVTSNIEYNKFDSPKTSRNITRGSNIETRGSTQEDYKKLNIKKRSEMWKENKFDFSSEFNVSNETARQNKELLNLLDNQYTTTNNVGIDEKRKKSRILSKELEAKYGIKLNYSDHDDGSDDEELEEDDNFDENFINEIHTNQFLEEPQIPNPIKSRTKIEEFIISKREALPICPVRSARGSICELKPRTEFRRESIDFRPKEVEQKTIPVRVNMENKVEDIPSKQDVFSTGSDFFQINSLNTRYTDFMTLYTEELKTLENQQKNKKKNWEEQKIGNDEYKPMMIWFSGEGSKIVQPKYMKNIGSMCYTEFWPKQLAHRMQRQLVRGGDYVRMSSHGRNFETVFRPKKWHQEDDMKKKLEGTLQAWKGGHEAEVISSNKAAKDKKKKTNGNGSKKQ